MNKEQLSPELSEQEILMYEEFAQELAKKHKVSKVHPVVMIDKDNEFERVVAYLKEPSFAVKLRIMDKATTIGIYSASDELREAITLQEESDSLTYGESFECDKFKMGINDYCLTLINRVQNQFKKK